ncbi:RING1 and YY1-binding protein, partial [Ophiophagus hannah]
MVACSDPSLSCSMDLSRDSISRFLLFGVDEELLSPDSLCHGYLSFSPCTPDVGERWKRPGSRHPVTVGNVTVIITDFKEKTRSSSTSSSTVTSSAGSEQQNQSSSGSESTDKGSSRSSTPKGDMSAPEKAASATSSSFSPCASTCFLDILPLIDDTWTLWSDCGHLATKEFRTLRITF